MGVCSVLFMILLILMIRKSFVTGAEMQEGEHRNCIEKERYGRFAWILSTANGVENGSMF